MSSVERGGLTLVAASVLSSVLGFLFWVLAARWFDAATVGTATATVAAMAFLATLSTLGLRNGILRFATGAGGFRFVRHVYLACAATALVAALVFLAGRPLWASGLDDLLGDPWLAGAFILATVAWVLFVLQDSALTASGRTRFVPAAQAAYGAGKIGMLALLAAIALPGAVFIAYSVPTVVIVVAVSLVVLRRPARPVPAEDPASIPPLRPLMRFAAAEHGAALVWLAAVDLLPLLVLERAGAAASAYYFLSFAAAYTLYLVASNFGSALLVAASRQPARLSELARRTLRSTMLLVLFGALLGVVLAPWFLALLGPGYAEHAGLLQLLLLSAIPQVIVGISAAVARVRRSLAALATQQIVLAALVILGADIGLRTVGLEGVGWAWLIAQTLVAVGVLTTTLRTIWIETIPLIVLAWLDRRWGLVTRLRRSREARSAIARLAAASGTAVTEISIVSAHHRTLIISARMDSLPVIVRASVDPEGRAAARNAADFLETLAADERLGRLRGLVPVVLHRLEDDMLIVESRLPGTNCIDPRPGGSPVARGRSSMVAVGRAIAEMQRLTAEAASADQAMKPIRARFAQLSKKLGPGTWATSLALLTDEICDALGNGSVRVSIRHGDLWAGNVLVDLADGGRVTGLIDWEDAHSNGISDVDLAHLWLTGGDGEIGSALLQALDDPTRFDAWLSEVGIRRLNPSLDARCILVLAWVEHVVGGLTRAPRGATATWLARNVDAPLRALVPERSDAAARAKPAGATDDARSGGVTSAGTTRHRRPSARDEEHP